MARYLNLDDVHSFGMRCDKHAPDLFEEDEVDGLQVCRITRENRASGESVLVSIENETVFSPSQLKRLRQYSQDAFQLFFVRQVRSWTTLKISRHLFQDLIDFCGAFWCFWDCAFTFGRKEEENNMEFPSYRARQIKLGSETEFESAYVLRRVELHGRECSEDEEPWSIRQTAVHHKSHSLDQSIPTFIVINPSTSAERMLLSSMSLALEDLRAVAPFNVHRILIADSLKNWRNYMGSLEERLREQSDQVIMTKVGEEKEDLSHLGDRNINFADRQKLKRLEDSIAELQVILNSLLNAVWGVRTQCEQYCKNLCLRKGLECDCQIMLGEFDSHIGELNVYIKRSTILHEQANGVAQLVCIVLRVKVKILISNS
ncbi:hypothetical protein PVAG01_08548 [Phlyctema vagabunda]|uniref:CorA-like transporter domain-containing protein n=1 Tax=Phlyctema vagabunda TaxID=108571 RepID=A0ABR4P9Q5_9HELO